MKILFSVFTIFCLFLFNSCSNNSGSPTGADGAAGGGGGGGGSVTFTITQGAGNQGGIIFYATPSAAVTITKVNSSVPAVQFTLDTQGDGTTVFPASKPVSINEFTGVASGQKWVFVFTGKLGSSTGTAFTATSNYTVP